MKARLLSARFHALPNVTSRVLPLALSLSGVTHHTLLHLAWVTSICCLFSEQAFSGSSIPYSQPLGASPWIYLWIFLTPLASLLLSLGCILFRPWLWGASLLAKLPVRCLHVSPSHQCHLCPHCPALIYAIGTIFSAPHMAISSSHTCTTSTPVGTYLVFPEPESGLPSYIFLWKLVVQIVFLWPTVR